MTSIARGNGDSGALFDMSGAIPVNATWQEDIYFQEAGAAMSLDDLDFKLTLRCDPKQDSADYTLSTGDGTLSLATDGDGVDVLRVNVPAGTFTRTGDYIADLASKDANDAVTHWAHGVVSLRNNPVTF
jgi:hypothetical protein